MPEWVPVLVSAGTAVLLLYVGFVMRNFSRSLERHDQVMEKLSERLTQIVERLAVVETKLEQK